MKIFKSAQDLKKFIRQAQAKGQKIGFVPTMGNLHQGHLSLIETSLSHNELTVVSIFVNPAQFGPGEDFDRYPRTLDHDVSLLKPLAQKQGALCLFTPEVEDIYPKGFSQYISAGALAQELEGLHRPGHFDGVLTVVNRLFELVSPHCAYFGKKDYQQLTLIRSMANERWPSLKIFGLPIIRENSGLALSSRNQYLSPAEKRQALKLKEALDLLMRAYEKSSNLEEPVQLAQRLSQEDKAFTYLSFRDPETLAPLTEKQNHAVILGNYTVNQVKLLDNIEVVIK